MHLQNSYRVIIDNVYVRIRTYAILHLILSNTSKYVGYLYNVASCFLLSSFIFCCLDFIYFFAKILIVIKDLTDWIRVLLSSYCGILFVAAGIVLFLIVEKIVRYVEENSGESNSWGHGHHHHHLKSSKKLKDDDDLGKTQSESSSGTEGIVSDEVSEDSLNGDNLAQHETLLRRVS